jgi:hypothetical protein
MDLFFFERIKAISDSIDLIAMYQDYIRNLLGQKSNEIIRIPCVSRL